MKLQLEMERITILSLHFFLLLLKFVSTNPQEPPLPPLPIQPPGTPGSSKPFLKIPISLPHGGPGGYGGSYKGSESAPSVIDPDRDPSKTINPITLQPNCLTQASSQNPEPLEFSLSSLLPNPNPSPKRRNRLRNAMCVPLSNCSSITVPLKNSATEGDFCSLTDINDLVDSIGICCDPVFNIITPDLQPGNSFPNPSVDLRILLHDAANPPILPSALSALAESTEQASQYLRNLGILHKSYIQRGIHLANGSRFFHPPLPEAQLVGTEGLGLVEVTRGLVSRLGVSGRINTASVINTYTGRMYCSSAAAPKCPKATKNYRQFDGSCNNPKYTKVGQTTTPLVRMTFPSYADGVFSVRIGVDPNDASLPSPRLVSATIATGDQRPSKFLTYLFAQQGQLVAHDMSHVPFPDLNGNLPIQCCSKIGKPLRNPEKNLHPLCMNIDVPENDPFYSVYQKQCLPFVRSMISSTKCSVGPAEQLNQVTHWMDLSIVYGPTDRVARSLRQFVGGKLQTLLFNGKVYLPMEPSCQSPLDTTECTFKTGDIRGNHQLYLTVLQIVWLREHNRIADVLSRYHQEWNDEIIFQEARKIVIAEYQHINYNEMIPLLVGPKAAQFFNLLPLSYGYTVFDLNVDGSVSNEHTTAAFRMGHSMIEDFVKIISNGRVANLSIHETMENSQYLFQDGVYDGSLRGLTRMSAENMDQWVTKELTQHLFQKFDKPYGSDLASTNINRGRDHGLPSYSDIVNFLSDYCKLPKINSFEDMTKLIPKPIVSDFQRLYPNFADVDAWIAGICEHPVPGGVVGPTFACIIGNQFARSKIGDRFYYEHGNLPNSFTEGQLQAIKRVSAARLFCDNGDNIESMQPLALRKISSLNPLVNCNNTFAIPVVDLSQWQNYQVY